MNMTYQHYIPHIVRYHELRDTSWGYIITKHNMQYKSLVIRIARHLFTTETVKQMERLFLQTSLTVCWVARANHAGIKGGGMSRVTSRNEACSHWNRQIAKIAKSLIFFYLIWSVLFRTVVGECKSSLGNPLQNVTNFCRGQNGGQFFQS